MNSWNYTNEFLGYVNKYFDFDIWFVGLYKSTFKIYDRSIGLYEWIVALCEWIIVFYEWIVEIYGFVAGFCEWIVGKICMHYMNVLLMAGAWMKC